MNIAVVGVGYVGLVSGACFAEMGIDVICVDIDTKKIEALQHGKIPIYEPHLEELVNKNITSGRLKFSSKLASVLNSVEIIFITVGTQLKDDGCQDISYVLDVAKNIGENLERYALIVTKSTVPIGTSLLIKKTIKKELKKRNIDVEFDVASNPEFLKEGNAIEDFMHPDRVVIGTDSRRAKELLESLYKPMQLSEQRMIFMDIASAEMAKFAANAMLATRISLMNEFANVCEKVGADISMIHKVLASDSRIGSKYLYAGCGYGGSCFPKDIRALIKIGEKNKQEMRILKSVEVVNITQKNILFEKFKKHFGNIKGRRVAIWGLSFKPETDDMRQAPSLVLIKQLIEAGCEVSVYDPVAMQECKRRIGDTVKYTTDIYQCCKKVDAIFHVTEWKEFRIPNWKKIKMLINDNAVIIDGRNVLIQTICKELNIYV